MSSVNQNGTNNNTNQNTNIPNQSNGVGYQNPNQIPAQNMNPNGQMYDQYGNPINTTNMGQGQIPNQVNPNMTAQGATNPKPQVIKQVEKKQGPTKVVYQNTKGQQNGNPPKQNSSNNKEEKKPGKIRYILLVLFFIVLLVIVWFLPDLRKMATDRKMESQEEVINGTLKCVYEEEDDLLTTLYTSEFQVENNKIKSYISTVETKGDTGSEEDLATKNEECELLTKMVKGISGVKSSCSLNSRKQTSIQEIDYSKVNQKKLTSAYSEAGGIVPDYTLDQDARDIKKDMTLARYSCTVN